MLEIIQAETSEHIEETRKIFREYEAWLDLDLCFQGFAAELANLPGKYAKPKGRLLLALSDRKVAGCVALRKPKRNFSNRFSKLRRKNRFCRTDSQT